MTQTKQDEPPSLFRPPLFVVGQNERGNWVAQTLDGVCGGLFVGRDAAMLTSVPKRGRSRRRSS